MAIFTTRAPEVLKLQKMKMNKTPIGSSERGNGKKSHEEEDTSHLRVQRDSETKKNISRIKEFLRVHYL